MEYYINYYVNIAKFVLSIVIIHTHTHTHKVVTLELEEERDKNMHLLPLKTFAFNSLFYYYRSKLLMNMLKFFNTTQSVGTKP